MRPGSRRAAGAIAGVDILRWCACGHNGRCGDESGAVLHLMSACEDFKSGGQSLIGGQPREARKNSYKTNNGFGEDEWTKKVKRESEYSVRRKKA